MDFIQIELLAIFWLVCGIASGLIGKTQAGKFVVGFLIGPLGVLISVLAASDGAKCVYCYKPVYKDSTRCPYCQSSFDETANAAIVASPLTRKQRSVRTVSQPLRRIDR